MALFDVPSGSGAALDGVRLAETVQALDYCNPFLPERVTLERQALGAEFTGREIAWNLRAETRGERVDNVARLTERVAKLVERARARLLGGESATQRDLELYEDVALFVLYHRFHALFQEHVARAIERDEDGGRPTFHAAFAEQARRLFAVDGVALPSAHQPSHLFAFFFQLNRAFSNIYRHIVGGSPAAARLRATIWQSIFTHDLRRYRRVLYERMEDIPTLVTGPSGTGKELVARAIGLSRYVPFDARSGAFTEDFVQSFHALNLSALSPTLIESELFGHKRGAFTGALDDRKGWFELCRPLGTVFLDEIGELEPALQVKLLRVLHTRVFQRLGETKARRFRGKVMAATNRDLSREMRGGRFREDLYYRLCADLIVTPSLREQLDGRPDDLRELVFFVAQRCAGDEALALTGEVMAWIDAELGLDYAWPGNFRELEQCVRNVLIRREYKPVARPPADPLRRLLDDVERGVLTADALLQRYCSLVYARAGSFEEAARRLDLDRRTVRAKVDRVWVKSLADRPPKESA